MATAPAKDVRIEKDSMGPMEVPNWAYYGAATQRAVLNFPVSDLRYSRRFIQVLACVKQSSAEVNMELGLLDRRIGEAIVKACQEGAGGKFDKHFVVDIFQTGSGTSTNMNANEVIANRAAELLGGKLGDKSVHPNDHVNMGQSSNDVIPTTPHLAALTSIQEQLIPALEGLRQALKQKEKELWKVVKTGRTHLQDATPIRMGQEFRGYASQVELGLRRLKHAREELAEVALGGTAVGTGIGTHPEFARRVCAKLSEKLGVPVKETPHHFQAQCTMDAVVEASGTLRTVAISLIKIANDLRWMGSGPRAGLGELLLPELQPGSSIMPGKVNPVIPESVIQVAAQVIGNDATVAVAGQGGYFELNMMWPVAGYNLQQSIELLASATENFTRQCVTGLVATRAGPDLVDKGLAIGTALAPVIGYDAAAAIAKEAAKTGKTIREVAKERTKLTDRELDKFLDPVTMVEPGRADIKAGG